VYPALWDISDPFLETHGLLRAYVPVPGLTGPFAALRVGAQKVFGSFPVHEAAFLGGRNNLRGFRTDRFAGDAALYGGAEVHVPVGTVELLTRGRLGVFGLADAGRVYFDGDSPGGWHTGLGGGLTFTTVGHTASLAYAHGELGRFYIELGLPF
jgi:hemolysin activation/secretion protein